MKIFSLKIEFIDCWLRDNMIPQTDRWLASINDLAIVVTAPTKQQAFEEIVTSLRVKAMYDSNYNPHKEKDI